MTYFITFLEGIFSFLSPCMLPMLPIYLSYFAGKADRQRGQISRILAFILGFTLSFTLLGVFFSLLGQVLTRYKVLLNMVSGGFMILFGLSFLDVVPLTMFKGMSKAARVEGALSAFVFGLIYSINLTPCIGAFLGSALMLVTAGGNVKQGVLLMILYSLGLGIPFLLAGILTVKLNVVFGVVKKHYALFNRVSGIFLICVGILTAVGGLDRMLRLLV
ncbi:MAG: cytochrome c biogenesis protein CcdA [Lachnospiraceae bacterium]|nr:cytochrome c biogenesis protein CcdA [Lachnospiraceae bacterium]